MSNESPYVSDFESLDAAYNETPGCVAADFLSPLDDPLPNFMDIGPNGDLYMLGENYFAGVQRISLNGALIGTFGSSLASAEQIRVAPTGDVYVFDGVATDKIHVFNENGEFITSFCTITTQGGGKGGSTGQVTDELTFSVNGWGFDSSGNLYISAGTPNSISPNPRLYHVQPFGSTGDVMASIGSTSGFGTRGSGISSSDVFHEFNESSLTIRRWSITGSSIDATTLSWSASGIYVASDALYTYDISGNSASTLPTLPVRLAIDTFARDVYYYPAGSVFLANSSAARNTDCIVADQNWVYAGYHGTIYVFGTTGNYSHHIPLNDEEFDYRGMESAEEPYQMCVDINSTDAWLTKPATNRVNKHRLETTDGGISGALIISINSSFNKPSGVCVSSTGDVYVVDRLNNRIQVFGTTGDFKFTWGSSGTGNGEFHLPWQIALDSNDDVYVTDRGNHRVQKFGTTGDYLLQWGSFGTGSGQFKHPCAIVADVSDNIWVSDIVLANVQKFDTTGGYLLSFGSAGTSGGAINECVGLAATTSGDIWAVDQTYHRCLRFNSTGAYQDMFGSTDPSATSLAKNSSDAYLMRPFSIIVGSSGYLFVGNRAWGGIKKFTSTGGFWAYGFV